MSLGLCNVQLDELFCPREMLALALQLRSCLLTLLLPWIICLRL